MDFLLSKDFLLGVTGVAVVLLGVLWLCIRKADKEAGYKEAKLETSEAENETIKENIKAAKIIEADINKLDDVAVKQLLKNKWTRK